MSLLLSSLVWFISVQISNKDSAAQQKGLLIFGVVLSVLLQETFRFAYYKLLKWVAATVFTAVSHTVSIITLTESFIFSVNLSIWCWAFYHHNDCDQFSITSFTVELWVLCINLHAEAIHLIFSIFWQQWMLTACVKMPVKSWLGEIWLKNRHPPHSCIITVRSLTWLKEGRKM